MNQKFVVMYFPDQVGCGEVEWDELAKLGYAKLKGPAFNPNKGESPPPGTGLGGSQKAECAYLKKFFPKAWGGVKKVSVSEL